MPDGIVRYVRFVDALNRGVGRVVMWGVFLIMAVLLYSSISKSFFLPSIWTLELVQFLMVAYFLLGGAHSMQLDSHVRMDLLYGRRSPRTKAAIDAITALFLLFYVGLLLFGGISSTSYALRYGETSYSSWAPRMAPIKVVMCVGIFLMLLQVVATFFKDIAAARGEPLE